MKGCGTSTVNRNNVDRLLARRVEKPPEPGWRSAFAGLTCLACSSASPYAEVALHSPWAQADVLADVAPLRRHRPARNSSLANAIHSEFENHKCEDFPARTQRPSVDSN
jgi:hypothetical protein